MENLRCKRNFKKDKKFFMIIGIAIRLNIQVIKICLVQRF